MTEEADTRLEEEWFNQQLAQRCLDALKKNNIAGYYASDRSEALTKIMGMIPPGAVIGIGDSITLHQVGVIDALDKRGSHQIFNPFRRPAGVEFDEVGVKALSAEIFLTGLNAVTLDGKLVNVDGRGNRVAGLIYGPKKVIAVAGINKIVADEEEARERIRRVAAPINSYRHALKHGMEALPCVLTGKCVDCRHPRRICNDTVIVEFQRFPRIEVVIIGERLGI